MDPSLFEEVVSIRRDLHKHPETGFDVDRTAGIAANLLESLGLSVKRGIGKTGVVADLKVDDSYKTVALRADMDALPIQEERESDYRSTVEGKAHLCGHDAHTAILLGTAKWLSGRRKQLKCNVRFIFQPSEELHPGGAPGMIADGCLDGVDEIYALHVWPWLESGTVGICPGPAMAQADSFDIAIKGRGGHAASPHLTTDPIIIGSQLVEAFQSIVSRSVAPLDPAVVTVTTFHCGSAYNVISSEAVLSGTVRTYSDKTQKLIKQRMKEILEHIVKSHSGDYEFSYKEGYPPVVNDERGCSRVREAGESFLRKEQLVHPSEKAMFGEDFAYYLQKVPGCFIHLGCRNESKNCVYPLHHPKFNLDEECMKTGMEVFVRLTC